MRILCLGISHHTADVAVRERFAVSEPAAVAAARELIAAEEIDEAVVLSTCNRVEVWAAAREAGGGFGVGRRFFDARGGVALYEHDSPESLRHLFRVVSGLESMVLGETEILGQVKKAYGAAAAGGTTARHLNKLFQRAFNAAKEVRSRTSITRGSVSVGSVAVDLAEKIFGRLSRCQVMILGAGETSETTARALLSRGARSIFVSNRSHERAAALAAEMGGTAIHFEQWHEQFHDVDILIGSTASPRPVITREKLAPVMRGRPDRPLFIIDLAVPRDVEPAVNALEGVYCYDIDSLRAIAAQSLEERRAEIAECERLIERHVEEFAGWLADAGSPRDRGSGSKMLEARS